MQLLSGSLGCEGAISRALVGGGPGQGAQLRLWFPVFGLLLSKDGWWGRGMGERGGHVHILNTKLYPVDMGSLGKF